LNGCAFDFGSRQCIGFCSIGSCKLGGGTNCACSF
jgi:hypothetical protein